MLRYSQSKHIKQYHFWCMGHNAILEEDWDELFAPPLITSTCFEQFEGHGRNEPYPQSQSYAMRRIFSSTPAVCNLYRPIWNPPPPSELKPVAPAIIRRPDPLPPPSAPEPLPVNTQQSQSYWARLLMEVIRGHRDLSAGVQPSCTELLPIHPLCYLCGYRKGGPDSWDNITCKCGYSAGPIVSPNGNYFHG
jgi:hypothetical protein